MYKLYSFSCTLSFFLYVIALVPRTISSPYSPSNHIYRGKTLPEAEAHKLGPFLLRQHLNFLLKKDNLWIEWSPSCRKLIHLFHIMISGWEAAWSIQEKLVCLLWTLLFFGCVSWMSKSLQHDIVSRSVVRSVLQSARCRSWEICAFSLTVVLPFYTITILKKRKKERDVAQIMLWKE